MRINPPEDVEWPTLDDGTKWEHETSNSPIAYVTDLITLTRVQQDKIEQLQSTVDEYKELPKPAEIKALREQLTNAHKQSESSNKEIEDLKRQLQVERAETSSMRKEAAALRAKMSMITANVNALPDPMVL